MDIGATGTIDEQVLVVAGGEVGLLQIQEDAVGLVSRKQLAGFFQPQQGGIIDGGATQRLSGR